MTSKTTNKFSPEVRARAVRMVLDPPWRPITKRAWTIAMPTTGPSVREWLKLELANGACGRRGAQNRKVEWGREVLNQFVEDVVGWLQDNYAPSAQALELASFRELRDGVRWARPDNYIDYLVQAGVLK